MKTRSFFAPLFVLFVAFVLSVASVSAQPTAVTEFDVNGMKVLIKRRPGTPTVAAGLFFRGGVRNQTAANAGIENFTLDVATEASRSYPRARLRKETSSIGTVITSGASYDYSALSLISTKTNFDKSWDIFTDVALSPSFAAADVERVRQGLLAVLRSANDSPEGALETLGRQTLYTGHPYAIAPEGTLETVTKLTSANLAAHHREMMQTSRLLLVVVGDVEPETLRARVARSFGKLPRGDFKEPPLSPIDFSKASLDITQKAVQTDYVKGTFAGPSLRDPDYYAMRTAITILQSAVFQEVRVKRNLSYAPDAELGERAANTGAISVTSVNPNEAVAVMLAEIEKLRQGSVDDDTIKQISGFFLTTHYIKQETNAAQAAELAQYELIGGGWRRSLEFLDRMRAVKASEVQAAAQKYMKNLRFTIVGNPDHIQRSVFLSAGSE